MELLPRITRAQTMDVLSSQANIAGYKAVLVAAYEYGRFMPMLMTAAGTVKAARVLVLGAGVAGLQAIATAKRLGAVIEAFDVRPAVKEQVESLGAKFVEVALSDEEKKAQESAGGYAREMSDDYKRRQAALIAERAKAADIVITTALIPGRPAPVLVTEDTVAGMKPGSVIVDLAVTQGGNCPLSKKDVVVDHHGVKIVAPSNLPATLAADASALYARNLLNFIDPAARPEDGRAHPRSIGRNHRGDAGLHRRRAGQELTLHGVAVDPIVTNLMVFVLAIFVGYHVVWNVTPALHTPLMSVTNAISSVIVVGAILAAGAGRIDRGTILGAIAVALVAINTFGGFLVTERMLEMFKKKDRAEKSTVTMSANQVALSYLVASVLFILALKGLSNPLTARRGNRFGIAGMTHRRAHHARDHPAHRSHDRRARRRRHRRLARRAARRR